uniref:Uncharacterized protein n=1 Tax=Anguilla anguilla TaxID=7936 RepID=A0A0E9U5M0_ANGAN
MLIDLSWCTALRLVCIKCVSCRYRQAADVL